MNTDIKIYIKYTLKDFRDFCFARTYGGIIRKILLVPFLLFFILMLICIPAGILLLLSEPDKLILFVPLVFMVIFVFFVIELLPFLISYMFYRNNYKKSKTFQNLQCIEVSKDKFMISSIEGSTLLLWDEIYKIQELRPCFLIFSASTKATILPKRCFVSQEQLDEFRNVLKNSIQKNKLKLKNYKLKHSFPDYGEIELETEKLVITEDFEDDQQEKPEFELDVLLEKKDLLIFNFLFFYSKPVGIVFTLFGIYLLITNLMCIKNIEYFSSFNIFLLISGIFFVFILPLMLFIRSSRAYENDPIIKKPIKYKIYKEHYIVKNSSSVTKIRWSELVKVVETKYGFFLYITTQLVHMIPKRCFISKEDDLLKIKEILKEFMGKNSNKCY